MQASSLTFTWLANLKEIELLEEVAADIEVGAH